MTRTACFAILALSLTVIARAEGPTAEELPAAPAAPTAAACTRLTPEALHAAQQSISSLESTAERAIAAHGAGAYPGAMKKALDYFTSARERLVTLEAWLKQLELLLPNVTNTSAAYNFAGYAREAISTLDVGRHWASVATAYDRSTIGRDLLTAAAGTHAVIADLESDGLTCYVSAYVP